MTCKGGGNTRGWALSASEGHSLASVGRSLGRYPPGSGTVMDDDHIWKSFYEKIKAEQEDDEQSASRIQDIDGGFFEKFGTLLKQQVKDDPLVPDDDVEEETPKVPEEQPIPEEEKEEIISDVIGLNIDELYLEVLYEILHIVGSDFDSSQKEALFQYLKDAFKLDDEKHSELLQLAEQKEAPNILLNIEVIQAKDLKPKDPNGLSDPFCTLYLTSSPSHRYNTSVRPETLTPRWEEHFSLPVGNPKEDILCMEVWDFDPAETVREKMTKISGVKGVRGLRKLMKEIAVTASTGKHDNEIIGTVEIPLKSIPSSGHDKWYTLVKKSKAKSQGVVNIKLGFSSEKNSKVAAQEHRHLLRLLILHELEMNKTDPVQWSGEFVGPAHIILTHHITQSGLSPSDEAMAQWVEYNRLHVNHPLNFRIFAQIIEKIIYPIKNGSYCEEELRIFWDAAKKLLPSAFSYIKNIRKHTPGEKKNIEQLTSILNVIAHLCALEPFNGVDLFPNNLYGWLQSENPNNSIMIILKAAIVQSANDWLQQLIDSKNSNEDSRDQILQDAIQVTQHTRADIQRAMEFHDKIFAKTVKIQYAQELYNVYDKKICELVEPIVAKISSLLKPIEFGREIVEESTNNSLDVGTSLFELYLNLQRFYMLGVGMFPTGIESLSISKFYTWFDHAVVQWLDIAVFKAFQRIDKAVDLDELVPVHSCVKYSSSAVDTLSIFYQVKTFWKQLAWPEAAGSYTFVAKILEEICRSCVNHYANKMSKKVEHLGFTESAYGEKYEVTNEWCLAINNIDYVGQSIQPFGDDLDLEDIIKNVAEYIDLSAADKCKQSLDGIMKSALENVHNKIIDLLQSAARQMSPSIKRFLLEGAELLHQDNNHVDRLMQYLDENLMTLHSQLSTDNFDRFLSIILEEVSIILKFVVEDNLDRRRPSSFFSNLNGTLKILTGFFKDGVNVDSNENFTRVKQLLTLHGTETEELIHQYHLERLEEQKALNNCPFGKLVVRVRFIDETLKINVIIAEKLQPHDTNGLCDPYVKIHLLPEEKFVHLSKPRTKTVKRSLNPLFDETFTLSLTKEQKNYDRGLIQFLVKDQDFLGMSSQFVGEAFIQFKDIPKAEGDEQLENLRTFHLNLSKPDKQNTEVYKALDHRQGEKLARDFIKRQKAKMQPMVPNS